MLSSSISSSGAAARPAARSSSRRTSGRSLALAPRAAKKADGPSVAIVGVTGAVGQEFLRVRILPSRGFFLLSLHVFVAARDSNPQSTGGLVSKHSAGGTRKKKAGEAIKTARRDR